MAITEFNKTNLPQLRSEINEALAAIGAKHGITLLAGNASYRGNEATFKLMMSVGEEKSARDIKIDKMSSALPLWWKLAFADRLDVNSIFKHGNMSFKVIGYNTRAKTMPFIIKDVANGKEYKVSKSDIEKAVVVK